MGLNISKCSESKFYFLVVVVLSVLLLPFLVVVVVLFHFQYEFLVQFTWAIVLHHEDIFL